MKKVLNVTVISGNPQHAAGIGMKLTSMQERMSVSPATSLVFVSKVSGQADVVLAYLTGSNNDDAALLDEANQMGDVVIAICNSGNFQRLSRGYATRAKKFIVTPTNQEEGEAAINAIIRSSD